MPLLYAQDPYHYFVDRSSGLPSNSVYDIFQDKVGFMWFATDEGLCSYDGAKFTTYYSDQQTSRSGSCISQDQYGRIWYSNFDGYLYYLSNGKLKALGNPKPRGYFKYGIADNFLYLIAEKGVMVYDLKSLNFVKLISLTDTELSAANTIDNKFYVVGTFLYEIGNGKLLRKMPFPKSVDNTSLHPVIIQQSAKGVAFVSKNSNYLHYLTPQNTFIKSTRTKNLSFVQNASRTIDGLWFCSPKGAQLSTLDGNQEKYFESYNVSYVFKDNRNNYWFSTVNKGIILVPDFKNKLIEMPSRPIRIERYNGKLLISTEDDALHQLDLNTNLKTEFYKGNSNHAINQLYADTLTGYVIFSSNTFNVLTKNRRKIVNARVAIKEVDKIDDKYYSFAASGSFGLFKLNKVDIKSEWDKLYSNGASNLYDFEQTTLRSQLNAKSTAYNSVSKTIYYATNLGLYCVNLQGQQEIKLDGKSLFIRKLVVYHNRTFALSNHGKLYEIVVGNKITLLQATSHIKSAYRVSLSGASLFVYTNSGIYRYYFPKEKLKKMPNSYQDFEITDIVEADGKLVMATAKGILIESLSNLEQPIKKTFIVGNVLVNNQIFTDKQLLKLTYNQNNLEIKYALLAFTPKEKANMYYKLNNDTWQRLTEQSGSIKLSSLSSGNYNVFFKVGKNQHPVKVTFTIGQPFWWSYWFVCLLVLLAITIAYILYRYQIKKNNLVNQQKLDRISLENNLNQSKLKAIKSQMNPHFFYNALNTIQSYILANDKRQAVSYLSKFANLTRTILEMSEKDEVSLAEEIKTIGFYLDIEKARFDADFDYQITEVGITSREDIKLPSMLLQPYLENAIKHGLLHKEGHKYLNITFTKTSERLVVAIEDNGIGRKKSMALNQIKQSKYKSFATAALQSRIELLNKNKTEKILIQYFDKVGENQQSTGTVVVIELPLNEN
ncbi:sensor histidine kinase [Pedobacter sp. SL55]|uniref:sensor histidine kinase n=1 Tax=Pedobacter sp. SL55 TaxID=2995161 RepID=UPI00226D8800|nr:histidine kinase [Pedobacter sp. SL55]WAC40293.1 histidine kinase [Pedobacter sp. SL55]